MKDVLACEKTQDGENFILFAQLWMKMIENLKLEDLKKKKKRKNA